MIEAVIFDMNGVIIVDEEFREKVLGKLQLPGGLLELLGYIKEKNIPLAVATSSRRGYVNFIMDTFNLRSFFPVIVSAEDVTNGKPDPEIYLKTAQSLGANPSNCLAFEDSTSGITSAKSANMTVVALTTTHTKEKLQGKADYIINSFQDFDRSLLD